MREIKFRVWDNTHKKMFVPTTLSFDHIPSAFTADNRRLDIGQNCEAMQFTGLKDKNGKEIYEGDVISTSEGHMPVVFANGGFVLRHRTKLNSYIVDGERYEVIGNIYENPELNK